jgi:LPS export ABC transporter protein LptC
MKRFLRYIITIVIGLLCVAADCQADKDKSDAVLGPATPRITLDEFSLTETKIGRRIWVLKGVHARVYEEAIEVDNIVIHFYNDEQEEFSCLYAPGGILNTNTRNILVGDSVTLLTSDSTKMYTDSLFWLNDSQQILTNCPVKIIKPDSTIIEGQGLRADPYLKKIEVVGTATGVSPIELPDIYGRKKKPEKPRKANP